MRYGDLATGRPEKTRRASQAIHVLPISSEHSQFDRFYKLTPNKLMPSVLKNNAVLNHYGMHSSGLNFYEGCADILFESNYVQNVIAINRSAENLTFRNNVVDSENRTAVSVAIWGSGRVGGKFIRNITFANNTFVNSKR